MDTEVAGLARVEADMAGGHVLAGALAAVVGDLRLRQIDYAPPCVGGTAAEVRLLTEHEVAGVEQADLPQHLPATHQRGPAQPIHPLYFVLRRVAHIEAAQGRSVR